MKYKEIIDKMTLEEKASLTSGKDFWQSQEIERLGVPSMFMADGPHGLRKQAAAADHLGLNPSIPATCFPTAATMANSWNEELGEEVGVALGEEAVSMNVNMLLGPGMNIKRSPLCGRNFEYFSEDPYLAGKMAAAYIRGIQENGVSACAKHFAVNSQELRRMSIDEQVDERALRELYLTAFEIAVKEGKAKAIMSSYNRLNGEYTNENKHLLVDILRNEWNFDGVIVTDWGGCNDRVEGLKATNEIEMPSCKASNEAIIRAVKGGTLDESVLDERIDNLLSFIFDTKIEDAKPFDVDKHALLAQKAAEESIVLLKNENNILPLKDEKIAVIGDFADVPRYQGAGSSVVNPTKLYKTLDYIKESGLNYVGYEKGFKRNGKKSNSLMKKAVSLASNADVVLYYMGLDEVTEAEGLDRENMKLPQNQLDLFDALKATGVKIVVVLSCGSAVEMDFADGADAILHSYLGGQATAKAVLRTVMGEVNPSGKLSESIPYKYADCSVSNTFPGREVTSVHKESVYIGYRYYEKANVPVRYPFGYGLSYASFEYSDIEVEENGVSVTVKNTGSLDGKEVVQLYVLKGESEIFRPVKELKGFKKVFIKANESVRVTIPFDDKTFRYFNVKTDKWEVEGGEYTLAIAASSNDIKLTATVLREGTTDVLPYEKDNIPSYLTGGIKDVSDGEFEVLLGRKLPSATYEFVKKNRIIIDINCTIEQLKYAKGWTGRVFSGAIRFAIGFLKAFGNKTTANTLVMGVLHQPMRGLQKFMGVSENQLNGLIIMFNGQFFKGLKTVFKK